ncbi:MAG: hemerythrin family protein [Gammaproteobacteria bacterium]|nr:hemerythrin family protein [Gammaproteobacteria bacterium]MBU1601420.1 hemerythrin family protein [Gammaproteobacteria bacterium]MBU2433615.1 hemerythrin family protein [Gammaproteobacteria bacterium]MBU2449847.1 hemerythrin family protein [Gammaproteobacteria bacterium]
MISQNFRFLPATFALNNHPLDSQHDGLFECLSALSKVSGDSADYLCNEIMSDLTGKMAQHFDCEEALMKKIGLKGELFDEHVAAHTAIMDEISHIHLTSITGGYGASSNLAPKVSAWVLSHITKFDLGLKPLIEEANRKN